MWGLAHRTDVRKTMALSTLVVERVFDGFTLLFFLVLAGLIQPLDGQAEVVQYGTLLFFGGVLVGLLLLLFFKEQTLRLATHFMWPVPERLRQRLLGMLGTFAQGLHALRQPQTLTGIVLASLLAWGSQALSFTMVLLAFGLPLSPVQLFNASILMLALINLIIMIPAGPGNVGTFETGGILALTIAGVALGQSERVAAIVLVTHMLQWFVVTSVGVFIAAQQGITLAGLSAGPEMNEG
jgi:glycosyltransferase 2 family protein